MKSENPFKVKLDEEVEKKIMSIEDINIEELKKTIKERLLVWDSKDYPEIFAWDKKDSISLKNLKEKISKAVEMYGDVEIGFEDSIDEHGDVEYNIYVVVENEISDEQVDSVLSDIIHEVQEKLSIIEKKKERLYQIVRFNAINHPPFDCLNDIIISSQNEINDEYRDINEMIKHGRTWTF